ncbi:hypothetical protein WMF28_42800 [Sorangium sp. So ce590]|uniref:hypothetical protein n=1 Tax=Sorangium sp. So ce590 TaxID=3133317 RepID=UPI003F6189B8
MRKPVAQDELSKAFATIARYLVDSMRDVANENAARETGGASRREDVADWADDLPLCGRRGRLRELEDRPQAHGALAKEYAERAEQAERAEHAPLVGHALPLAGLTVSEKLARIMSGQSGMSDDDAVAALSRLGAESDARRYQRRP